MEFANQLLLVGVLFYLIGFATSLVLPQRWTNPAKVTISCNECDWKATFKDRAKDPGPLIAKMKGLHKRHYTSTHPEKDWEDHTE